MRKSLVALAPLVLLLASCSTAAPAQSEDAGSSHGEHAEHAQSDSNAQEQAAAQTRLAMTYDGGILVLNAEDLDVIADISLEGFNRLNPAGDGRHAVVSTSEGFQVLDMGTWAQAHGDHFHYYTAEPKLTDVVYSASEPGHVVAGEGITTLFSDGTGQIHIVPTEDVATMAGATKLKVEAHHGVAVPFDENFLVTTPDRQGVAVMTPQGESVTEGKDCPDVHGEAVVDDTAVFGCSDGALLYHDGVFSKVTSPDENGRMGTLVASPESDVVLSNYTPGYSGDANENEITQVALIDVESKQVRPVDLGTGYSFRSLARGDNGEAIVLGADGKLHVLDPESGSEVAAHQVIDAWEVPADWQKPRPAVFVADGTAYVTDPAQKKLYAVDIETGEVWLTGDLPQEVNELTGVTGFGVSVEETDHHDHEGHDHEEGHDHDHSESGHEHEDAH